MSARERWRLCVAGAAFALMAPAAPAQDVTELGPAAPQSRVPAWDARGLGPLPRQGIACADMTPEADRIALGTIAPPGDPNVVVLDGEGKRVGLGRAGQRFVGAVVLGEGGRSCLALVTTPRGTAGDRPEIFRLDVPTGPASAPEGAPCDALMFHYGDHSNHLGAFLRAAGEKVVLACGQRASWLSPEGTRVAEASLHVPGGEIASAALSPSGHLIVGCVARPAADGEPARNLFRLSAETKKPLWSRPADPDTDAAPPPEAGLYGPPAPPHRDAKLWAPLAVAVDARDRLVAAADYQGWERSFAAAGLRRPERYGVRFTPARPAIRVYDREGNLVRAFDRGLFKEPFWCDLLFTPDGERLLAVPHRWTCRGLAGQTLLPADEGARSVYVLEIATGKANVLRFPDAISDAASGGGKIAVACFNGRIYILDAQGRPLPSAAGGWPVGAASLVRISADGSRLLAAGTDGVVRMLDSNGRELWQVDLNRAVPSGEKPWTRNQKAGLIGPGIWSSNSGRAHSDLGGQYVVEAPEGLILIDPNAGLSIEQNWARIEGAGLDPRRIRYVLLTHEHGDHAPGAYLWRVLTGAQVAAGAECAYILQHHLPIGTGYGFHPPNPVDLVVKEDTDLNLAGLKVRAIRLPGHTYGSMGWMFEKDGKSWVATGDLIMPGGALGYSGSINFSAQDVLASLRKLERLRPGGILGGHGPQGDPAPALKGVEVGEATGWGKMRPERPDPFYGFSRRNYLIAAWMEPVQTSAFGDIDGDGRPDVAVLAGASQGSIVKVYLNRGGRFDPQPDAQVALTEMESGSRLRLGHLNADRTADFLAGSESLAVLLVSKPGKLEYEVAPLPGVVRASQMVPGDFNADGRIDCLVGGRFVDGCWLASPSADGRFKTSRLPAKMRGYFELQGIEAGPGRPPWLVSSAGEVFPWREGGTLPEKPALELSRPAEGWTFMGIGDFNGDKRPDAALLASAGREVKLAVFYQTADPGGPFSPRPDSVLALPWEGGVLRDGPTAADWNGDGVDDLALCRDQGSKVCVLLGSAAGGLKSEASVTVTVDYRIHFDTRIALADFNGDGRADLAGFGHSSAGAPGVYVWLQPSGDK